MADYLQQKERLPSVDLDPEDLRIIFDSIDEHLSFWNVLYNDEVRSQDDERLPVSLEQVSAVSDWLKMSSAPLYPSEGLGGARGLVYRSVNLAVKIFGSPQIGFNRKLRDFLNELLFTLDAFNKQALALRALIEQNAASIQSLEAENSDYRQEIDTLTSQLAAARADLDQIMSERDSERGA